MPPMVPTLKLTYYDFEARATTIRKVLNMGGVPFVDERLSRDEFLQRKPSLPYGMIPVLEVDGELLAETQPILRYVGRLAGMYPADPLAGAMVDEMMDSFEDFFERVMMPSFAEDDEGKKKQIREALVKGPLPHAFGLLDRRLAAILEHPFFKADPSMVSILDVLAWDWVSYFVSGGAEPIPKTFANDYKTILAMYNKVEANPRLPQSQPNALKMTATPLPKKLQLTYFDMPGRAEQIRLAFQIGGIAFQDERLSFEDVTKRKATFPNEQVPVLRVDDQFSLGQSVAILRYIGGFAGLYPTEDAVQALRIDELLAHIGELYFALDPSFAESDPEKKKQMREVLTAKTFPESLSSLNRRLAHWKKNAKSSSLYAMGGESPTIADLGIYSLVMFLKSGFLDHVPTSIVDEYAEIVSASDAVKQHPRVQQWYAKASQPAV